MYKYTDVTTSSIYQYFYNEKHSVEDDTLFAYITNDTADTTIYFKYNDGDKYVELPYNIETLVGNEAVTFSPRNYKIYIREKIPNNKILYGNETLIDLSGDTARESDVSLGKTFHKADGSQATGTATGGGTAITPSDSSPVPLTKDSSYTIENNGGYAVTFDESTVSKNDVIKNKKYVDENGVHTGTRPYGYIYEHDYVCNYSWDYFTDFCFLGNYLVSMEKSTDNKSVILSTIKSDGITKSSITICSPGVSYIDSFVVMGVHYFTTNAMLIEYQYKTSSTAYTAIYARIICIKNDGTLVLGSQVSTTSTPASTEEVDGMLIPDLLDNGVSFLRVHSRKNKSNSTYTLIIVDTVCNIYSTSISFSNSADLYGNSFGYYCPVLYHNNNSGYAASKGGLFYTNTSNVDYILLRYKNGYNGMRNITLDDADSSGFLASIGSLNHFVLGMTQNGFLVTAKKVNNLLWVIYLFYLDFTNATNIMSKFIEFNINSIYDIISFENNIITFKNGDRYQYCESKKTFKKIYSTTLKTKTLGLEKPLIGVGGNLFNMVGNCEV